MDVALFDFDLPEDVARTLVELCQAHLRRTDRTSWAKNYAPPLRRIVHLTREVQGRSSRRAGVSRTAKQPGRIRAIRSGPRSALASLSVNYSEIGRETGLLAKRIVDGEKPLPSKPVSAQRVSISVNHKTARYLGIVIPKELDSFIDETY
ncbi:MAG: hypothetical protein HC794_01225 [Nitrospiraceae bacterium]|nr:hypothetical protein [Nitrospiraceae bacterium]